MHASLSDRELSICSHQLGLLVSLTERFGNQPVTAGLIRSPIRPMIDEKACFRDSFGISTHFSLYLGCL